MLRELQRVVAQSWNESTYSPAFRASAVPHKNFQHAFLHVVKVLGKFAPMIDDADHTGDVSVFKYKDLRKYVADLVICAARMANTAPDGPFNLADAVQARTVEKMGVPLKE